MARMVTALLVLALLSLPPASPADGPLDAAVDRLGSADPKERESAAATLFAAGAEGLAALDRAEASAAEARDAGAVERRLAMKRLRLRIPVPRVWIRVPAGPFRFGPPPGEERTLPELSLIHI